MIYTEFAGEKLSLLGFGTMRLPMLDAKAGIVDEEQVAAMVRLAAEGGVNYYDTAYPYHESKSEVIIGKALKQLPRESYYLATKYPGHQIASSYDPEEIFEEQLKKCDVDYFDFYLLHNVYENSIPVYEDPQWGIIDYFVKQKKLGRIKHLGFSCHALLPAMKEFVEKYDGVFEFVQIQLNYLDWTLQNAKDKVEYLASKGLGVWVMEPVRGGTLASLKPEAEAKLRALRPEESDAAWAFRFLQGVPAVKMILSGMSNMEQMAQNIKTFEERKPLNALESQTLLEIAEGMKSNVPCTACGYCKAGCPMQLDIPTMISMYNETRVAMRPNVGMYFDSVDALKRPEACIGCGACARTCPQKIDVPEVLKDLSERLKKLPSWAALCKAREEAAKKQKEAQKG